MSLDPKFRLKTNPFRMTPAISSDEIIWAGFSDLKVKIERRIKRSMKIPNSSLVLNWGEYGSGKTHSARYFSKDSVLKKMASCLGVSTPYSMVITLPKGKEPVYDIFISIIDKIELTEIRNLFVNAKLDLSDLIKNITDNLFIQSILNAIFDVDVDTSLLKKYLYGQTTKAELNSLNVATSENILRPLKTDSDYINLMSGFFSCLTYNKEIYSSIIIWIDEFEDIAILSSSNIDKTNNFLRELLDNTPNNLLIFLNLTQSAILGLSDLGDYIFDSVRSRIKERNNYELPSKEEFKLYLREMLAYYRIGNGSVDDYFPFTEAIIDNIIDEIGNSSLRAFNESLSLLLELADMDNENAPISDGYFSDMKNEIIGWKNE